MERSARTKLEAVMNSKRLEPIAQRIDDVLRGPQAIGSQTLFRFARPFFALAGWRASIAATALSDLLGHLRTKTATAALFDAAVAELEANVVAIERFAIVKKRAPVAHALWLRRVVAVLTLVEIALANPADEVAARAARRTDESALLPPLVPLEKETKRGEAASEDTTDVRVLDLELAAIDHLIAAARAETAMLGRKRRLMFAARQRLLEASAALPLDRPGVKERTRWLAREIMRIDRLQAAGLAPDVALVHQARQALTRRDPKRLFAALAAIDANALQVADRELAGRTGRIIARRWKDDEGLESLRRSGEEMLGKVASDVDRAIDDARSDAQHRLVMGGAPSEREAAEELLEYLPEDAGATIVRAAVAADGLFEVGGALAPMRIVEEARIPRIVRHPTQDLVLVHADDPSDLRDAIITDPRSVLLDLATGRLFARRFVREEVVKKSRVVMRGEVRIYVLDGSGSMKGPRARVRDAILVAELSTLIARLEAPNDTRCTLFYRYFTDELGLTHKIDTVKKARDAIRDVVVNERSGGTDIQAALLASLEQIQEAQATDKELARAQIVLVTDGEAPVDEAAVEDAKKKLGDLPIGISVIALGEENPALRAIVARQRAKGVAAFYHFLDDAELAAIAEGSLGGDLAIHPPSRWTELEKDPAALARALDDECFALLEELEGIDRERDLSALERIEAETQARRELGITDEDGAGDGERARIEALQKDNVALAARYARWFPPATPATSAEQLPERDREEIEAVACARASVAEVVTLLGGSRLARQADAIDLFERLLPDARLTPGRYRAIVREHPHAIARPLQALHDAVTGPPKT